METGYQLTRQDLVYIALIGAGVGLLLGLIPLIIAIRKGSAPASTDAAAPSDTSQPE